MGSNVSAGTGFRNQRRGLGSIWGEILFMRKITNNWYEGTAYLPWDQQTQCSPEPSGPLSSSRVHRPSARAQTIRTYDTRGTFTTPGQMHGTAADH